jgi:hypothetical protein
MLNLQNIAEQKLVMSESMKNRHIITATERQKTVILTSYMYQGVVGYLVHHCLLAYSCQSSILEKSYQLLI